METIYHKLLAFQKLNISVKKDGKNPHFKSAYATLNEVLDKVKKPLNDIGVVIIFTPELEGLKTTLRDIESGTEITGFMKHVGSDTAQKLLACNTYFRRGSLVSMLGLEDEDDDGTKASDPAKEFRKVEKDFVSDPIEKIKSAKDTKDLTALYNSMPPSQQKVEHIIEAFKKQKLTFKTK